MIGRFVRIATLAFSLFSVFYWIGVMSLVQIIDLLHNEGKVSGFAGWAATAIPTILYGLLCALFLQWFARGVVRRIQPRDKL